MSMFYMNDIIVHQRTNMFYIILDSPNDDFRSRINRSPYYKYKKLNAYDRKVFTSSKTELENGNFRYARISYPVYDYIPFDEYCRSLNHGTCITGEFRGCFWHP